MKRIATSLLILGLTFLAVPAASDDKPGPPPIEAAWKMLPAYEHGQDMAPLLAVDRAVIEAMAAPASRAACATRLASLLEAPQTTLAAKQYICLQMRQVGTAAEVPILARLLATPETSQMARYALESIPGEQSLAALRDGLKTLRGKPLLGLVQSLGARRDRQSVPALGKLVDSDDPQLAAAALAALGRIGDPQATSLLTARANSAKALPRELAVALLRCAETALAAGDRDTAGKLFKQLGTATAPVGARRAALEGQLRLKGKAASELLVTWLLEGNADQRRLAAGRVDEFSDEQVDRLADQLPALDASGKVAVLQTLASRKGKAVLPMAAELVKSDDEASRLAGLRLLAVAGTEAAIPALVDSLLRGGATGDAARQALLSLPRRQVADALLDVLKRRPKGWPNAVEALVKMKLYEAIDPLVAIAESDDTAVYAPALEALRGIADPDQTDVSRLVKLLLRTPRSQRRDEIEKTILIVCDKVPPKTDRAAPVLQALKAIPSAAPGAYLPLLGRLGGPQAMKRIDAALKADDPAEQEAAVRALCNWPDAKVADRLMQIATSSENPAHRQWALRAYVRVVSLPSDRSEAATLALLRKAMHIAQRPADQCLVIERAAAVRTMDSVQWIATCLDKPELAQAACQSLVALAHHRFLRHPNMDRFGPILDRVAEISKDPDVVQRAKRYRLGL